mmetsp:Transcript_11864/g.43381  ORF Transcript_11864/g.43381 Transcript_11864/m.43381 type:complete len:156 (-) Transcript_11864:158-625(-)|eukprot:scaffold1504_cov417-Prasinococcus_capsulatus_cf.AAC.32
MGLLSTSQEGAYWERVTRLHNMLDWRSLGTSASDIESARKLVQRHRHGEPVNQSELRKATRIVDATVHPDTQLPIFAPLRVSAIVPMNLLLDTLMLSAKGTAANIGAQWLNQTYNALHYYANRNASNDTASNMRLFQSYLGATVSSVSAVVGADP